MDNHPITPPPELVEQWIKDWTKMVHQWALVKDDKDAEKPPGPSEYAATQAARWGADQELEACCKLLELSDPNAREFLAAARRPKPPSLKQQALEAWEQCWGSECLIQKGSYADTIRRAIEQLPDE